MPAFVINGPDIPESLLQEHERGRVVFFCGAGISIPAGLPEFHKLVEQLYSELGTQKTPIEKKSFENEQYDATIDQLERRYPGKRSKVRSKLITILTPNWCKKDTTVTHQALLQLATDRKGAVRIVTTNFDQIFKRVIGKKKLGIPLLAAPFLPIPKPSRWCGVVHLHGLLPDKSTDMELNRLVLSSGDFGLAYLTERWAARFVSELFRNYTVCFVGYGINDPVLRYMMDALAADRLLGEFVLDTYAFASFKDGCEEKTRIEWEAKGVEPLLYKISAAEDHSILHRTLKEWADTYRDGIHGKEMIITQHASTPPLASSRSDFAVRRVLWALTDDLAAKHFADLNPVPPLEWIKPLSENQFEYDDLSRFGIVPNNDKDTKLHFNILCRPTPYTHAPRMSITSMGRQERNWDSVMYHLARWLTRHLNDPKLFLWLVEGGGALNDSFVHLVRDQIKKFDQLEKEEKHDELERIRSNSPSAIPCKSMRTLWRFILSGQVKTHTYECDLYDWIPRFNQDGLTLSLRLELREILAPCVTFRPPFDPSLKESTDSTESKIKDYVDCDFTLRSDYAHDAHHTLKDKINKPTWQAALPDLLYDFTALLRDALDLMRELDYADDKHDFSDIPQPSISNHPQNTDFHDWTVLIELNRDAWIVVAESDPARAYHVAEQWWQTPYPVFKRLVFFAATYNSVISHEQALDWLLSDNYWWLWSTTTLRETIRLVVILAPVLPEERLKELEQAILSGPPRKMFRDNLEWEKWLEIVDHTIWLRLAKAEDAGTSLGRDAKSKLDELKKKHPQWKLAEDERDEFSTYIETGSGLIDFILIPKRRRELVKWLKENEKHDPWKQDDWRDRCRSNFSTTACALYQLSQENNWPVARWNQALQAWKEDAYLERSWRYIANILYKAPDEVMKEISHNVSWWIQDQAKTFNGQKELFFLLSDRILEIEYEDDKYDSNDPIFRAINHPIGHVTQGLLSWWYRQKPKNSEGLRDEIKPLFSKICDPKIEKFRHGRVQLATHAISLFRIDEEWTKSYLLPLFDWAHSENEAREAWIGFLRSPQLYWPLLSAIKKELLKTASHYKQLGDHARQYANLLTHLSLNRNELFTESELIDATYHLPLEGLQRSSLTLVKAIEGAGEQKDEYWRNRVLPYIKKIWPHDERWIDPTISKNFCDLCLVAENEFPSALQELQAWLKPVSSAGLIIRDLKKTDVCRRFPEDALKFLDVIIDNDVWILTEELKNCLDEIKSAKPPLAEDHRFKKLMKIYQKKHIS